MAFEYCDKRIRLHRPPHGKVQRLIEAEGCSFIEWAPGNGYVYRLVISRLPAEMHEALAARFLLSVQNDDLRFYSYPVNPGSMYEWSYVCEKWPVKGEEAQNFTVMLMNWALFGASEYAEELWRELLEKRPALLA